MILGIISLLLDALILNTINYYIDSSFIFPMFSFVFLISSVYFSDDYKPFFIFLYSTVYGIIYLPLLIIVLNYVFRSKKTLNNYLLRIILSLILYDFLFFLILSKTDITLLINKIIVTIPINIMYSLILYFVLKRKNKKYNLLW